MAAHADRALNFLTRARFRKRTLGALHGCGAAITVAVGVLGLGASWPRQLLETWINIHVLFAVLMWGMVLARWQWRLTRSSNRLPGDIREASRRLSRIIYLGLYIIIGARQTIAILNSVLHGGDVDFNLFDERFRNGAGDDLQWLLATGLSMLVFIRALAFKLWLRALERAAPID